MNKIKNVSLVTLLILLLVPAAIAGPGRAKLAADLAEQLDRGAFEARVIVTYDDSFGDADLDAVRARGGSVHKRLNGIRGIAGTPSRHDVEELSDDPRVLSISPDRRVAGDLDVAVPATGAGRITGHLGYTGHRPVPTDPFQQRLTGRGPRRGRRLRAGRSPGAVERQRVGQRRLSAHRQIENTEPRPRTRLFPFRAPSAI